MVLKEKRRYLSVFFSMVLVCKILRYKKDCVVLISAAKVLLIFDPTKFFHML